MGQKKENKTVFISPNWRRKRGILEGKE